MRWTPVIGSLAINAALLALLGVLSARMESPAPREPIEIEVIDVPYLESPRSALVSNGGGGEARTPDHVETRTVETHASHVEARAPNHIDAQRSPWADVDMRYEESSAEVGNGGGGIGGAGGGIGNGSGPGIGVGIGNGIGVGELRDIAALRVPEPSQARPAKLLHPTRETEVDAAELYVAIVTVDTDGDVVGARMTRSHPGSRGDTAASMIWQFRYSPALDDAGHPVPSTFEQTFAVR